MIFSKQILNGSQDILFIFMALFFKYETIETHACSFLAFIILTIAGVSQKLIHSENIPGHIVDAGPAEGLKIRWGASRDGGIICRSTGYNRVDLCAKFDRRPCHCFHRP